MYWADFHVHSTFSDGKLTIPQLVDFYGSRGFGAIAITDHLCEQKSWLGRAARLLERTLTPANFPIYREIIQSQAERAWEQYRMVVIAGFELTQNNVSNHRSAHIVALGAQDFIAADGDPLELARAIRAQGALAVAAHPVPTRKMEKQTLHLWDRREELASEFDAWEVASGPHWFHEVANSGLPMLATSDLHSVRQIHAWKTRLDCERSPDAILDAIRRQQLKFEFYEESEDSHDLRRWIALEHLGSGRLPADLRHPLDAQAL